MEKKLKRLTRPRLNGVARKLGVKNLKLYKKKQELINHIIKTYSTDKIEAALRIPLWKIFWENRSDLYGIATLISLIVGIVGVVLSVIFYLNGQNVQRENQALRKENIRLTNALKGVPLRAVGWKILGEMWSNQGQHENAMGYFKKVLPVYEAVYGKIHPKIADLYNKLGRAKEMLSKYGAAKIFYQNALDIDRKCFGEAHPIVAKDLLILGDTLKFDGKYDGAIEKYEEAKVIFTKAEGDYSKEIESLEKKLKDARYAAKILDGVLIEEKTAKPKGYWHRVINLLEKMIDNISHTIERNLKKYKIIQICWPIVTPAWKASDNEKSGQEKK